MLVAADWRGCADARLRKNVLVEPRLHARRLIFTPLRNCSVRVLRRNANSGTPQRFNNFMSSTLKIWMRRHFTRSPSCSRVTMVVTTHVICERLR